MKIHVAPLPMAFLVAGSLLSACAGPAPSAQPTRPATAPAAKPIEKAMASSAATTQAAQGSQAILDTIKAAAEKEGRVVVYDALPATSMDPVINAFQGKYPLIKVDYVGLRLASQITTRLVQDTQAKAKTADAASFVEDAVPELQRSLGIKTIVQTFDWKTVGVLPELSLRYPSPEDQLGVKYNSSLWSIQYNKDLVSKEPTWQDFMDPKWKGKVALTRLAIPWAALSIAWGESKVTDFLTRLFRDRQPRLYDTAAALANGVAAGEVAMGFGLRHSATPGVKEGAPVGLSLADTLVNSGTVIGIPVNAEHPNAAKLYIAWLVSPEGQAVYDQSTDRGLAEIRGTWANENFGKLKDRVAEWPLGQNLDEKESVYNRINKLFPAS